MFAWREDLGPARLRITDRRGGVSAPPYDGLNLALHVGDDVAAVHANRELLAGALGVASEWLVFMDQCHGGDVAVVDGPPGQPLQVDAMVTRRPGLALVVLVADCTPVLAVDADAGVVGVAHAGRAGLVAQVVPAMIEAMQRLGAGAIQARVGPSICELCYPVPRALQEQTAAAVPTACATSRSGEPALDIAGGVVSQLVACGVGVTPVSGCNAEDPTYFSYRRDRVTGRYAGVALLA